jgi:hypothetical protein
MRVFGNESPGPGLFEAQSRPAGGGVSALAAAFAADLPAESLASSFETF